MTGSLYIVARGGRTAVPAALLIATACMAVLPTAGADQFRLAAGGVVHGKLLNPDQQPRTDYHIQLNSGGRLILAADQVQGVVNQGDLLRSYEAMLPRVPHSLEGHWDMAQRCQQGGLSEQREFHLEQVLKFDPDHEAARHALGYSKVEDRWVRVDEWMQQQGYVRHEGRWRLPQEIRLEELENAYEQAVIERRQEIRRWRNDLIRDRNTQAALDGFFGLKDAAAAMPLAELLDNVKESRQLKMLYIDTMARLPAPGVVVPAFIKCAMEDPDEDVRDRCLERLRQQGTEQAVAVLVKGLENNDNRVVNRSAAALGRLGHPDAILPLIDALITKHKFLISTGAGTNAAFSPDGGGGLTTGGGPKMIERPIQNPDVLAALTVLSPQGVNFGYQQEAWRQWYIRRNVPIEVDLRRDR